MTSIYPKYGLRHIPRSYKSSPDVRKFYVNILECCYDSSFRALSEVGNTSGCQIRPPQLLERLVMSVKYTSLVQ